MGTTRPVQVKVDLRTLVEACNSVGAHIGAKLGSFHSDERTLTDEVCDMFAIWATSVPSPRKLQSKLGLIDLKIQKLTASEEATVGADLEIKLLTPNGIKRALFQAKVIDPNSGKLRQNSRVAQKKLRDQLRLAESAAFTDLAFLLLYVPWHLLDGSRWSFPTWEQGFAGKTSGQLKSYMGTAVVPLHDLTGNNGRWKYRPALRHVGAFKSKLNHFSLTRILLEMACCKRGSASPRDSQDIQDSERQMVTRNLLSIGISPVEKDWSEMEDLIRQLLDNPSKFELSL